MGSRDILRHYFLTHLGDVIDTDTLAEVAGTRAYARRIRDLRNEEGYRILTSRDRPDLRPGQYLLEDPTPRPVRPTISLTERNRALEAAKYRCSRCGLTAGEEHPSDARKRLSLHVVPAFEGEALDSGDGLIVLCSACKAGFRPATRAGDDEFLQLWRTVREAPRELQLRLLEVLEVTFRG